MSARDVRDNEIGSLRPMIYTIYLLLGAGVATFVLATIVVILLRDELIEAIVEKRIIERYHEDCCC